MAITIEIPGGERIEIAEHLASIGRDRACKVALPDATQLQARHANLRRVGNRWMIESAGDWLIQTGSTPPSRMNWLTAGDVIRLTESGPELRFEPTGSRPQGASAVTDSRLTDLVKDELHRTVEPPQAANRTSVTERPQTTTPASVTSVPVTAAPSPASTNPASAFIEPNKSSEAIRGLANHPLAYVVVTAIVAMAIFLVARSDPGGRNPPTTRVITKVTKVPGQATTTTVKDRDESRLLTGKPDEPAIQSNSEGVVWIGFRKSDFVFMYASGWMVRPDRVATTASVVNRLQSLQKSDIDIVVHFNGRVIRARELKYHSKFDPDNPGSPESIAHNVGVLSLEQSLEIQCEIADQAELGRLTTETPLIAIGYNNTGADLEPFDRLKVRANRQSGKLLGSDQVSSSGKTWYKTDFISSKGMEGAAVMTHTGKIIGLLVPYPTQTTVVPADKVSEVLQR